MMVDRMQRHGIMVAGADDALLAEAEDVTGGGAGGAAAPAGTAGAEAAKAAQQAAARARMQAAAGKK
jgi:hypothetical protein